MYIKYIYTHPLFLLPFPNSFPALSEYPLGKTHGNGSSINSPSTSPVRLHNNAAKY